MAGKDPASQQVTLFRAAAGADHPRSRPRQPTKSKAAWSS
jgi:hypothetical protein